MEPYLEKTLHKNRAGGVVQSVGPEFKPQHRKKSAYFLDFDFSCSKPPKIHAQMFHRIQLLFKDTCTVRSTKLLFKESGALCGFLD
jgi:hypothetical protein